MGKIDDGLRSLIEPPAPKPAPAPAIDVNALAAAIVEAAKLAAPRTVARAPTGWRVQVVRREGLIEEFLIYPLAPGA